MAVPSFITRLRDRERFAVQVILSQAARQFVAPLTLQRLSSTNVVIDAVEDRIELAKSMFADTDLMVVMPATGDILGKAAAGICDDAVSVAIASAPRQVLFVPSMNGMMWDSAATQRNVRTLRKSGFAVMEPTVGLEIADWKPSKGGMPRSASIVSEIRRLIGDSRQKPRSSGDEIHERPD